MIAITSLNQLLRDGEDLGAVFDSVANHKLSLPDVQRAMIAYVEGLEATHAEAITAKDAEIAALNDYIARVGAVKQAIFNVIQNPEVDDTMTVVSIAAVIAEAEKPEAEKPEADKVRAEKMAQLESLKLELGIE